MDIKTIQKIEEMITRNVEVILSKGAGHQGKKDFQEFENQNMQLEIGQGMGNRKLTLIRYPAMASCNL